MTSFTLPSIPVPLYWHNDPLRWQVNADSALTITAGELTDWFVDPNGSVNIGNAPSALFTPPDADFVLSAKVSVNLMTMYDAGVLRVQVGDDVWAKLCFEYSPQQEPMIVSVVTRGTSDDCNSVIIDGNSIYLRIARIGQAFAFHYSHDGQLWHMVRHFGLGPLDQIEIGFSAQSPRGEQFTAVFSEIAYAARTVQDIRSGE